MQYDQESWSRTQILVNIRKWFFIFPKICIFSIIHILWDIICCLKSQHMLTKIQIWKYELSAFYSYLQSSQRPSGRSERLYIVKNLSKRFIHLVKTAPGQWIARYSIGVVSWSSKFIFNLSFGQFRGSNTFYARKMLFRA